MSLIDIKALKSLLEQIEQEKRIPKEKLLEALEFALAAAYKKDFGKRDQVIRCTLNTETGDTEFCQVKTIVDDSTVKLLEDEEEEEAGTMRDSTLESDTEELPRFNSERHIMIDDARRMRSSASLGEEILFPLDEPEEDFGRVAAQTAKQVITQKLREAERDSISDEYAGKEGEIVTGVIQRFDRGNVYVDLGRAIGVLAKEERLPNEFYQPGKHIKVYLYRVDDQKGLQLRLSRAHPEFLKKLFANESPEIANGAVEIKAIAREPGGKTKIAVASNDDSIDPVGACVGQKGVRVNAVSTELGGEKIDIIPWSEEMAEFIAAAIGPAEPIEITLNDETREATIMVPDNQLSLAIGRGGQNVRLAAKLTGWRIDIIGDGSLPPMETNRTKTAHAAPEPEVEFSAEPDDIMESSADQAQGDVEEFVETEHIGDTDDSTADAISSVPETTEE